MNCRRFLGIIGGLSILFCGLVLSSTKVDAEESVVDIMRLGVPESCTLSGSNNTIEETVENGIYDSSVGTSTLKAFCNDNSGFSIYAVGYTDNTYGKNVMSSSAGPTWDVATGTAQSGETSNWAMKLTASPGTYAATIENGFTNFSAVPATFTKVVSRASATDVGENASGATVNASYAFYASSSQPAGLYIGQVKYVLVHPVTGMPAQPQPSTAGYINYYANASTAVGTMGRQSASDGNTVQLFASNFSRDGYGFAGWSDAYDYATNPNAHFYGPNEDITVPTGTTANGLALYAVWIKSAGTMQANAQSVCNSLTAATYSNEGDSDESTWSITAGLSSISALTDTRDGDTYAIAKLTDGNCWMIENLRLADTHQEGGNTVNTTLTIQNTNNPLNDGTTVILKHNYSDSTTYTNLSATSSVAYNATSAPSGWCTTDSADCYDQSRIRTDSTTNRIIYASTSTNMTSHDVNFYSYGNYYNWYSATAGRGTYDLRTDVIGDLCPSGWHLPTSIGSGDFGVLSNSLGGYKNASNVAQQMTNSTTPTGTILSKRFRNFPSNYLYSGNVTAGADFNGRGISNSFWSSKTTSRKEQAYALNFTSVVVYPGIGVLVKGAGGSVRCIVSIGGVS